MGATLISRPELRNRLAHPNPGPNGQPGTPMPAAGLPLLTYTGTLTFNMDGEEVHIYAIPRAHTDGDTIAQFVNADIIMTGDFYRSVQFPNIDRANGGSLRGLEDGLSRVIALSGPNTRIVPGHGAMVDRSAVMAHRDIVIAVHKKVADLIKQGKSQDEVIAAKPAAEFTSKIKEVGMTEVRFFGQVYAEAPKAELQPLRPRSGPRSTLPLQSGHRAARREARGPLQTVFPPPVPVSLSKTPLPFALAAGRVPATCAPLAC